MRMTNRNWLPAYCDPRSYLPKIQETATLFSRPPYLFRDFVGRALRFLKSARAKKMGFEYDPQNTLPCKWKCADECLFGVDLAIYANTGQYPFDKGSIGGRFQPGSLGAAVHHGRINVDFGGSHVGYVPGDSGGHFGQIWRPLEHELSTDCGALCHAISPFLAVYKDACSNIQVVKPRGVDEVLLSIPNEFVQPSWSSHHIKLLVDTENLTDGDVPFVPDRPHTHTPIGRTLFHLRREFLDQIPKEDARRFFSGKPTPIGRNLTYHYFNIYDSQTQLDKHGLPELKIEPYMKYIVSAKNSPAPLKAAIVNANLEYNRLTDAVRDAAYRNYAFASFTGVFIDMFDEKLGNYVNLFQPLGVTIKPARALHVIEILPEEIADIFSRVKPASPARRLAHVMGAESSNIVERFTFVPGRFRE